MALLKIDGVSKSYGSKVALDSVSFEVPQGSIFGLLGPNGAGKTTLIRIINRILIPTAGDVVFNGRSITEEDVRKIGYLPEERGLYRKMKVGEQAMYFARLKGMSTAQAREALKYWFRKFGIESWWDKKVEELSKGMAQKVQFITTVVHDPDLMILDEPFSGFDPVNAQLIRNEILELKKKGRTIILSTHNMESVEELCDEIALINKSHLVVNGGVNEVRRRYGSNNVELEYTLPEASSAPGTGIPAACQAYTVISDTEEDSGRHRAVLAVAAGLDLNAVLAALIGQGIRINAVKELIPRMNDIFIKLVTEGE